MFGPVRFNDVFRTWRNRARRYDPDSIVRQALQILNEPVDDPVEELRKAPWLSLLMVKWVCQDAFQDNKWAPPCTRAQVDELRQRLWEFPDSLAARGRETLPMRLFIRQLLRPQLGFQRRLTKSFVREAALLSMQGADHPLCEVFRRKTGFGLEEFVDFSVAAFSAILNGNRVIGATFFDPLEATYGTEAIAAFRKQVSRDFAELVNFCRSLPHAGEKVASEYYEFPAVTRYPFFRDCDELKVWHPTVFYRGMEGFVHSVLSEEGQDYIDRFSRMFERHVVEECQRVPCDFLDEETLRACVAEGSRVPDGLLSFPGVNVFVESKAGLFDESVMAIGHNEMFRRKTRAITTGVGQAWATCASLRERGVASHDVLDAELDYLLIVTNKELGASRGTALAEIYPAGSLVYPSDLAEQYLPLSRIYVLSIDDFERMVSAAAAETISIPGFLAACVADDEIPEQQLMLFEQHLNRRGVQLEFSAIVNTAFQESTSRLERAMRG